MQLAKLSVVFDDGREVTLSLKPSDLLYVERTTKTSVRKIDVDSLEVRALAAWHALRRENVEGVPDSVEDFIDMIDIATLRFGESEGKPSAPDQ